MKLKFEAVAMPSRYKYGFLLGAASLAVVIVMLITARTTETMPFADAAPSLYVSTGTFSRGLTLYDALKQASLTPPVIHEVGSALQRALDPRTLKGSDAFEIVLTPDSAFRQLVITRGLQQFIVDKTADALDVQTRAIPLTAEERVSGGLLKGSLWESMRASGMSPEVIMQFSDIFAWNLDFLTEPREGDRYALVWQADSTADGTVAARKIVAAFYDGRETGRHVAVLHNGEYYDADGNSVRKAFLHAPLNFRRISSGFSLRRFHPVLRYFRPHMGIDYAAPRGTPIISVGDGTVAFKGWKRVYGNWLQVRHNGTYTSCYAHLSAYARGLRLGSRVKQGQVIGYVGATGLATGPHLDFRMIKNRKFVNFLKLQFPPDRQVPAAEKSAFQGTVHKRLGELEAFFKNQKIS